MPPFTQQVTFLYTPVLATTARFYEQVLGLELVLDQGVCRIYRLSRDGFVGFCQKDGVEPRPQTVIITFVTPDVEAWYTRLSAQGVPLENPPPDPPRAFAKEMVGTPTKDNTRHAAINLVVFKRYVLSMERENSLKPHPNLA